MKHHSHRHIILGVLFIAFAFVTAMVSAETLKVGSKKFTESVILGEMIRLLAEDTGMDVHHQRELGGTRVLWDALLAGEIDAYPEYTGTLLQEILVAENVRDDDQLRRELAVRGIIMTQPLGFNNTYALGMKAALAEQLGIHSISDLRRHPDLVMGFGSEFMHRADGWPGLKKHYRLPHTDVRGLDHDLAYRGIASDALQVIDLYATDAEIDYYDLSALRDNLGFFPAYHAVILYRADLEDSAPAAVRTGYFVCDGYHPDHSFPGAVRVHDSTPGYRRAACYSRAVSLQPVTDCSQYTCCFDRYSSVGAGFGRCTGLAAHRAASAGRITAQCDYHSGRHQDLGGHKYRYGNIGRIDWRRRLWPTNPYRHSSG